MTLTLPTVEQTARKHRDADAKCGRKWQCACGACRQVRASGKYGWERAELLDDECECEHLRDDHEDGTGICEERASSGAMCSCPSFKATA